MLTQNEQVKKKMFQAWRSEEIKLWTSEEDKVTMAILKNWEVQEANREVQEAKPEKLTLMNCVLRPHQHL